MVSRLDYLTKLSRGEISASSEGSDDDNDLVENDFSDDDDENKDSSSRAQSHKSPLDIEEEEDISLGDPTTRLAILNCDWDHIRAKDIM